MGPVDRRRAGVRGGISVEPGTPAEAGRRLPSVRVVLYVSRPVDLVHPRCTQFGNALVLELLELVDRGIASTSESIVKRRPHGRASSIQGVDQMADRLPGDLCGIPTVAWSTAKNPVGVQSAKLGLRPGPVDRQAGQRLVCQLVLELSGVVDLTTSVRTANNRETRVLKRIPCGIRTRF